jgi:glycosyltransferase involved in cell wall biosynthesis
MALTEALLRRNGAVGLASCVDRRPAYHIKNRGLDWFDAAGVPYYYVPFPDAQRERRGRLDALRAVRALYRAVRDFEPDVLHLHSFSLFPYAWVVRLLTGVPIVSTIHLDVNPKRTGVALLRAINGILPVLPDRLVALCREQEAQFQTLLRAPDDRIVRIPHGIDETHFRPPRPAERAAARARFGLDPDDPTVCLIGRLDYVKGHDVLIRALTRLREMGVPVTALLAGTGAGEANIRQAVDAAGLTDAVHFLGFADSREVLWASDVTVLPSRVEAFPLVILESMLCGVPTVRTPASGAYDQITDGTTGFIIPFDDDEALADRLAQLLTDPVERAEMAKAALSRARNEFTADAMIDRTLALYGDVSGTVAPPVEQRSPESAAVPAGPDLP